MAQGLQRTSQYNYNMLNNKYLYARNHGLLPEAPPAQNMSPITSYGLVASSNNFEVKVNYQKNAVVMYNSQEYLHRRFSYVFRGSEASSIINKIETAYPQQDQSLTVFVAAEPRQSQLIILGIESKNSLLGLAYQKLKANKKADSKIVLSVIGIHDENSLTDQLLHTKKQLVSTEFSIPKVVRYKNSRSYYVQNITRYVIESNEDLFPILNSYLRCKSDFEIARAGEKDWDWLSGQLFQLAEVQYDMASMKFQQIINCHYILKINQYLGSTSNLMLKIGMRLRMMQTVLHLGVNSKQSSLFQLLGDCFAKNNQFKIHLFLQIGHSDSINQQYLNLVPTSSIKKIDSHFQQISLLYLKHYLDYEPVLQLISKITDNNQSRPQSSSLVMSQFPIMSKKRAKSYVNGTLSSMEKRRAIRLSVFDEPEQKQEKAHNVQNLIKQAVKLYRRSDQRKSRGSAFRLSNLSLYKSKQKQDKKSLYEWELPEKSEKIKVKEYTDKNQPNCNAKKAKWIKTVYGSSIISSLRKQNTDRPTKNMTKKSVKREVINLGKQDQIFPQDYEDL